MFSMQQQILQIVPPKIRPYAEETFDKYAINTVFRAVPFLAQVMHESGDFERKQENLNYSAQRLLQVFKKYFDEETALRYDHKKEMIGSRVYANRYGNRDEASGDGYRFRGRGFIHITFFENYEKLGKHLGVDLITNPDLLLEDRYAMLSAGWFWSVKKLNDIADKGLTETEVKEITKKVNGGLNGLADRIEKLNQICTRI